ncbi:hypothetical protein J6590_036028 [Homalodisca vitripennis]|nr:hypothetical protein J6590_072489 [Homalodisca vitripennis]KAG8306951.1 hypothetical protein J6590_036028 [Homalodisca vitripennis]
MLHICQRGILNPIPEFTPKNTPRNAACLLDNFFTDPWRFPGSGSSRSGTVEDTSGSNIRHCLLDLFPAIATRVRADPEAPDTQQTREVFACLFKVGHYWLQRVRL